MRTGGLLQWLAIWVFVVGLAVTGTWLFVSGLVPFAPPDGTFQVVNSRTTATSSTALTVSPASPVALGAPVTLSTTITGATAAGFMQFKDGSTNVGDPVRVTNNTARQTTSTLAAGPHRLIALFIPSDPTALRPSTSEVTLLTITTLPAITPQQSGLSLDNPAPANLDQQTNYWP